MINCLLLPGQSASANAANDNRHRAASNQIPLSKQSNNLERAITARYQQLPLRFEANIGQVDTQADFVVRNSRYDLLLAADEAILAFTGQPSHLSVKLLNADPGAIATGLEPLTGKSNYFIGQEKANWQSDVPAYQRVQYRNIYPGIDINYYGRQQQLAYQFIIAPGVDAKQIQIGLDAVTTSYLTEPGTLILKTADGEIVQPLPVIYQQVGDVNRFVTGRYLVTDQHQIGFELGDYDPSLPLVIESTLGLVSYLNDNSGSDNYRLAIDDQNNIYLVGSTKPLDLSFAATVKALTSDQADIFIAKFSADKNELLYITYLGGSSTEQIEAIDIDKQGNLYLTGATESADYPVIAAWQTNFAGRPDIFVSKFDTVGATLNYSSYFGNTGIDWGIGIDADNQGNVYISGFTTSPQGFPLTANAYQSEYALQMDAFLIKVDTNISGADSLRYGSYLGGRNYDQSVAVVADEQGNAYLTGMTISSNFPVTANGAQLSYGEGGDLFIVKIDTNASTNSESLVYASFLGGRGGDAGSDIVLDNTGGVYILGVTGSTKNFPITANALQTNYGGGGSDLFIARIDANLSGNASLTFSSYFGGSGTDLGFALALDSANSLYLTGRTDSADFPLKGRVEKFRGSDDIFVTKLAATVAGNFQLDYSTYLGNDGDDVGFDIAVDQSGSMYIIGTISEKLNLGSDPFLIKLLPRSQQVEFK